MKLRGISSDAYALYQTAKSLYTGKESITISELADPEIISGPVFTIILKAEYDHCIFILNALEIGDALAADCKVEEISGDYPILKRLEGTCVNADELDYLVKQIESFDKRELGQFQAVAAGQSIHTVRDFINLTFCCQNVTPVIPDNLPEEVYELLDYEAIGRKTRMGEGGVFTEKGYVCAHALKSAGEMAQIYKSGDAIPQGKPNYTVMLEVCKGWFSDPEYNSGASEYPMLPADDGIIQRAIAQVEAKSIEECSIRAEDCIVPKLSDIISDALYASDGDCYGTVNELAVQLQRLEQSGKLYTYKAMVEAAPQDITLEEAIDLSRQVEWFSVTKGATSPASYAKDILSKYCIEQADELFASTNLQRYGEKLIAEKGVAMTEYGNWMGRQWNSGSAAPDKA